MSNDLNCVTLVGRLTKDSEMKYTSGGMAISKFSLAIGKRVKKGDGYEDYTSFIDCTVFGKTAENLNQYLVKGKQIAVVGELHQDRWESEGKKNSRIGVNCNSIQLIGDKGSSSGATGGKPNADSPAPASATPEFPDDIDW